MKSKLLRIEKRKLRTRSKFNKEDIRLSIFRSNKYLSAQILNGDKTVFGAVENKVIPEIDRKKTKTERAKIFGIEFAKEALKRKISKVIFDRGPYLFHGRVKAFADGAREGGLVF